MRLETYYDKIDNPVQEAVIRLHKKGIPTHSSDGGGSKNHGTCDFVYIETKLNRINLMICKRFKFLLNKIYSSNNKEDLLFNGSAFQYGKRTGYYVMGFNRGNLTDGAVINKFKNIIARLKPQK